MRQQFGNLMSMMLEPYLDHKVFLIGIMMTLIYSAIINIKCHHQTHSRKHLKEKRNVIVTKSANNKHFQNYQINKTSNTTRITVVSFQNEHKSYMITMSDDEKSVERSERKQWHGEKIRNLDQCARENIQEAQDF